MGELDQISMKIGSIESMLTDGVRQRETMFRKLDDLGDRITEIGGITKLVNERHSALKAKVDTQIIPAIDDLNSMKNRGMGILAGVALAAGGAAAGISKLMAKVLSE